MCYWSDIPTLVQCGRGLHRLWTPRGQDLGGWRPCFCISWKSIMENSPSLITLNFSYPVFQLPWSKVWIKGVKWIFSFSLLLFKIMSWFPRIHLSDQWIIFIVNMNWWFNIFIMFKSSTYICHYFPRYFVVLFFCCLFLIPKLFCLWLMGNPSCWLLCLFCTNPVVSNSFFVFWYHEIFQVPLVCFPP